MYPDSGIKIITLTSQIVLMYIIHIYLHIWSAQATITDEGLIKKKKTKTKPPIVYFSRSLRLKVQGQVALQIGYLVPWTELSTVSLPG